MATFQFDLVAPERVLFSGQVEAVLLPASDGDMTVLPGHAPVMTSLKTGVIVATKHQGSGERVLVRGGFAEIGPNNVTVLAERATLMQELTPESIEREILDIAMQRDATEDYAKKDILAGTIDQLREAKAALNF